jgi:hypothetical protein
MEDYVRIEKLNKNKQICSFKLNIRKFFLMIRTVCDGFIVIIHLI